MFRNILPPGARGVVVVVDNPCNPSFTYVLDGPEAVYVGKGDQHESKFEGEGLKSSIFTLEKYRRTGSRYAGPTLDRDFCPFTFRIYPSSQMEADYLSNNPAIYTAAAICIFVFTSLVFILYDCSVERRQKVVMRSAEKSNAVVSR